LAQLEQGVAEATPAFEEFRKPRAQAWGLRDPCDALTQAVLGADGAIRSALAGTSLLQDLGQQEPSGHMGGIGSQREAQEMLSAISHAFESLGHGARAAQSLG
jgi:hypothetical protein